jgi:GNAT superfamily N-acetyltransferase
MALIIDRFKEIDKEDWFNLWHQADGFSLQFNRLDIPESTWQRIMSGENKLLAFGLRNEDTEKLVGFVIYRFNASPKVAGDECCISDIFIEPEFCGQGGGKKLLAAVDQAAREAKAERLCWIANPNRAESMNFYNSVEAEQNLRAHFVRWLGRA